MNSQIIEDAIQYADVGQSNNEADMPHYEKVADHLQAFYNSIQADPDMNVAAELKKVNEQIQDIFDGK